MKELIKQLKNPMFASRETIDEAYDYMEMVAKASDNPMAVITACQVVVNTICKELENHNYIIYDVTRPMISIDHLRTAFMCKSDLEKIVEGWVNG